MLLLVCLPPPIQLPIHFFKNIKTKYHGWMKLVSLFILYFIFKNDLKEALFIVCVCTIFNIKTESFSFFLFSSIVSQKTLSCRVHSVVIYSWYRQIQINFYFMMYLYFMKSLNSFFNIFIRRIISTWRSLCVYTLYKDVVDSNIVHRWW